MRTNSPDEKASERRGHPRVYRSLVLQHRCPAIDRETWMMSLLRDISQSGARFTHPGGYRRGLLLELRLQLPIFKNPYPLTGCVVWAKRLDAETEEVGIRFVLDPGDDATPLTLARIVRYFQECLESPPTGRTA